jgi:radical SAM-linked protein
MPKCRLFFEKTGRAKYLSHLDLMRTFQRAFLRADFPLRHSEGFNPHPLLSIALPLALGCESYCEVLDTEFPESARAEQNAPFPGLCALLNHVLPEGIRMRAAAEPLAKPAAIRRVLCRAELFYDEKPDDLAEKLRVFWTAEDITIAKKTKSGVAPLNLAPHIDAMRVRETARGAALEARLSAREPTLNPANLADALAALAPELAPAFCACARLALFREDGAPFA